MPTIDQVKKRALVEHIRQRQLSNKEEILLAPDLYFDGYEDEQCSVCANVGPYSTLQFADRLREVARRPDVAAVFIRFYDYDDALEFEDSWIGSDSVYLVTSASLDTVRECFADFDVSDVWNEKDISKFPDILRLPDGFGLVAVWWD